MTVVHQLIPAANPRDALTSQAFAWRDLLAEWGHPGEIVSEHIHPELDGQVHRLDRRGRRLLAQGKVILRYAIYSETSGIALATPERVALCYHNITPGHLLRDYNSALAELCDRGRRALATFPPPAVLVADSS